MIEATPDTGCTRSIISARIARKHGLIPTEDNTKLITADGSKMNVAGKVIMKAKTASSSTYIDALISSSLAEEMLVSWQDLTRLKIIPGNFPTVQQRAFAVTTESFTTQLVAEFGDVIRDSLPNERNTAAPPMKIKLVDKPVPKKVTTARRIPMRFEKEAGNMVGGLIDTGVIKRYEGNSDWCSPAFFVPKPDNVRVRLVTDFTELNKYVKRPVHLFPSSSDIMQAIPPEAKLFAKFDAVNGYFQLPLDEESQALTAFLLPEGKFVYCVAPMGLNASSDEWCAYSDKIIEGLTWARKIVDDTLIWATNWEELTERAKVILERCRDLGITISKKKLEAGPSITFAGHLVSADGIRADDNKYKAIREFPRPTCVKDLRGFMGLANQLAPLHPDLAHMTATIRPLLKKNTAWLWLDEHEEEFKKVKEMLTSKHVVKPYDTSLDTVLLTDASRLYGLGFALMQKVNEKKWNLVMCGSKSLTPTQQRYATIELECMAIQWAIVKCDYYLRGAPTFQVLTDHKPLKGIFNKDLHMLENARLMRMREKIQQYNFTVDWVAGETHKIADALSRYPVFAAQEEDLQVDSAVKCMQAREDPGLRSIYEGIDDNYIEIIDAVKRGEDANSKQNGVLREYRQTFNRLSIQETGERELLLLDSTRIVIPRGARKAILNELHRAHSGMTKTFKTAEQLFYWPGMRNDIANKIGDCSACAEERPSQARAEITADLPSQAEYPMKHVATDLYDLQGHSYLVLTDRYSGYGWQARLRKTATRNVTDQLTGWFNEYGWPDYIRSDGGPQFRSEFKDFCAKRDITHEVASAHNPESNGLAESAVKSLKQITRRCMKGKEDIASAIAAWRNMAREDGNSPAQLFFNRRQKHFLPMTSLHKCLEEQNYKAKDRVAERSLLQRNKHTIPYEILKPNQRVRMQHHVHKTWEDRVTVKAARPDMLSYIVITDSGRELVRGRRFLRSIREHKKAEKPGEDISSPDEQEKPTSTMPSKKKSSINRCQRVRSTTDNENSEDVWQITSAGDADIKLRFTRVKHPNNGGWTVKRTGACPHKGGNGQLHNKSVFRIPRAGAPRRDTTNRNPARDSCNPRGHRRKVVGLAPQKAEGRKGDSETAATSTLQPKGAAGRRDSGGIRQGDRPAHLQPEGEHLQDAEIPVITRAATQREETLGSRTHTAATRPRQLSIPSTEWPTPREEATARPGTPRPKYSEVLANPKPTTPAFSDTPSFVVLGPSMEEQIRTLENMKLEPEEPKVEEPPEEEYWDHYDSGQTFTYGQGWSSNVYPEIDNWSECGWEENSTKKEEVFSTPQGLALAPAVYRSLQDAALDLSSRESSSL